MKLTDEKMNHMMVDIKTWGFVATFVVSHGNFNMDGYPAATTTVSK